MLLNKTCLCRLNNAKHFLKSTNWTKYGLAQSIHSPVNQNIKTISVNANSCANLTQFQNSFTRIPPVKCLPASLVMSQKYMSSSSSDHVRLWQIERITSAVLPILLPASLILESSIIDSLVAALVVVHTHWGLEAIVVDYARPIVVGSVLPKVLHLLLYFLSTVTLAGLLVLIFNGPGISKTVKNIWNIGKEEPTHK